MAESQKVPRREWRIRAGWRGRKNAHPGEGASSCSAAILSSQLAISPARPCAPESGSRLHPGCAKPRHHHGTELRCSGFCALSSLPRAWGVRSEVGAGKVGSWARGHANVEANLTRGLVPVGGARDGDLSGRWWSLFGRVACICGLCVAPT